MSEKIIRGFTVVPMPVLSQGTTNKEQRTYPPRTNGTAGLVGP